MPRIIAGLIATFWLYQAVGQDIPCKNLESVMASEISAIGKNFSPRKAKQFHPRLSEYWEVKESCLTSAAKSGEEPPFDKALIEVSIWMVSQANNSYMNKSNLTKSEMEAFVSAYQVPASRLNK